MCCFTFLSRLNTLQGLASSSCSQEEKHLEIQHVHQTSKKAEQQKKK